MRSRVAMACCLALGAVGLEEARPQTVLFLGYTDDYRTPFLGEALPPGNTPTDLEQQSRALFFKIGYAWVL